MLDSGYITAINFHPADNSPLDKDVYIKLVAEDGQTVYATSDVKNLNVRWDWITFTLSSAAKLSKDTKYGLQFNDVTTD